MGDFFKKCSSNFRRAMDATFISNIANIVILIVAALLVIALMIKPMILIALALFGLFIWAILYC